MKFYEDFIGEDTADTTVYYTGGDTEEHYLQNVQSQAEDWYYKNKNITYDFNKHGHRSKNISDIDLDNYILFAGCSHTMGVGLELETTYPYITSKQLGLDYYNLAIAASGPDVLQHNVLNWYYTVPKKPKLIMIQWPDHSRFLSYNTEYKNLMPKGNWRGDDETLRFIVDCEDSGLFYARKKFITELMSNVIQVPLIKFNYANQIGYDHDPLKMRKVDLARDLAHSGPMSHKKFSESIAPVIFEKLGLHLP